MRQEPPRRNIGDPLAPILALGHRQLRVGATLGLVGALILHAAPAVQAARSFSDVRGFATHVRELVQQRLLSEVDLETVAPPPPPPEPEPPPPPEAPPAAPEAPPPKPVAAAPEPPPAPAQASNLLTSEPDPDAPVDLTDEGFVTGTSDRYAGGVTSSKGTSQTAVRDLNAAPGGVPGGTGKVPAPPGPASPLARPAQPDSSRNWKDCGFPAEADIEGINNAVVTLVVTVGPDGRAKAVSVVKDPGYGFGKLARQCALRKPYIVGLDNGGRPVTKTTVPFPVRFTR
ncbi:MAG TPA: energy transducer TonB [Polyangiaceae bacterium]|nr:energy transducer TonB [Polyangiaceae bacterium]